jgi:hypothetical protein
MDLVEEILRPLLTELLVTTWLKTDPADPDSLDDLKHWIKERSRSSTTFASFADLTLATMGSVTLRRKGIRRNVKAAHQAGRKDILPLLSVTGRHQYAYASHISDLVATAVEQRRSAHASASASATQPPESDET